MRRAPGLARATPRRPSPRRRAQALFRTRTHLPDFQSHIRALPPALRSSYEQQLEGGINQKDGGGGVNNAADDGEREFGFVRASLMGQLRSDGNWQARSLAIAQLQRELAEISEEQKVQVAPHLGALLDFLARMLDDSNFKIMLTSLQARAAPLSCPLP